ncbi:Glycosyltransferase involved in cell wall bisynthesis [Clostridium collagenovorans DSM 3089]|uniref:Glycosyltransferase involved in cell wall bisynthesis n=1 Tax=Clostridium collagenovorans DSM 3089 TaxID=1121306 RepID=A0A1M5X390_9CLOT|nr:glycosyltransferase family A protein [Clostridium collagenovorans]SHH94279.1 Glycosyltransferase involved in cell wall bisynthesis [Clostridium collagenovorans DSM 3089]
MVKGMISCIIPTYKRSDTLIRAINSVINQTYKNIEILVIDDNDPNSEESMLVEKRLKDIFDKRLRYIKQLKHINGAAARNVGIKSSNGEFIAFLDDDDEWEYTKLERQMDVFLNDINCSGVSTLYKYYKNGVPIRKCSVYETNDLHKKVLERSVAICTPTVLLKKSCIDESGYFDESLIRHQDIQLFLDFLLKYNIKLLPEYMVRINTELEENRPTTQNIISIKEEFFKKTQRHFEIYDKKVQRQIYSAHYFEIILVAIRERNYKIVIKYIMKIGININAYLSVLRRFKERNRNSITSK